MDPRLQRRIQRYGWDAAMPHYGDAWAMALKPAQDTLLREAAPKPGERVLEVACGTGLVTLPVADAVGSAGHVLATDISGEMVTKTREAAEAAGCGNIDVERMDAEEMDVDAGAFDLAVCALGLMYVPDPRKALVEMRRALKPDGRITVTVWGERRNCGWADIFPIVDDRVQSEVCPMFFFPGAPGVLAGDLEAAGFTEIRECRQSEILAFADREHLLTAMIDGGAVAMAAKRFSDEVRKAVDEDFLASVNDYANSDGRFGIPGEFLTVSAVARPA